MLQRARNAESKSLLREIENALVLIENDKDKDYFLERFNEVFLKRQDSKILFTGERDLKSELLAYLKQFGYLRTANVWARNIPMDRELINALLGILQERLLAAGIQGVLEIHLQDREINSPHIQFVGIRCEEAEVIIAQTLVELKYELSMESALSKKDFMPYYEINSKARVRNLEDEIKYIKELKKRQEEEREERAEEEFLKIAKEAREYLKQIKTKRENLAQRMEQLSTNLTAYKQGLQSKKYRLKRLRRRIGKRLVKV
ncbi:hypothetical protein [Helicobacter turcicus]|uniref:Uncharacterized protein n=1 Tax=Helicobacter turcicus TaxID=2867412 RepID=A0ABS7JPG1_9HELI|nr:hypothetical protein [Helicobacter turcicus]MBX7491286.1 hypothetical protein [Helicobacter turcicus]MBX7546075.1 hypothetical protein [Helicobacter turcicus]